ncbi:branched-chain amino acid ABC transporter permease [Parasalinivibrio latis]|uniref:branched-chain amino acid ABC transporter permease n=1 Tax=Parasalinivibrio latis TaxID=2952610 RepID=UPI0006D27035
MDIFSSLLPHIINGLSLGLLFALIALGFMLIVGVMELINLAHGSLFALGAYFAMTIIAPDPSYLGPFGDWYTGLPLASRYIVGLLFAPILVAAIGMLLEICMRRTYGKKAEYGLLLTFGAALVIEEIIRIVWGSGEQLLPVPEAISGAFISGGMIYSTYRFYAAGFGILMILLVWLFLEKTPYGNIIKAGAHDSEMVRALGVNLTRLRLYIFAFGALLAAVAGITLTPIWGLRPHIGVDVVIPAFVIIVLGGIGSFWGAVIAGILVGLVVAIVGAYATQWSMLSMYILLIVIITFRSRGLVGKKSTLEN